MATTASSIESEVASRAADLSLVVYGKAAPQGSKRAFVNPRTGKAVMTEASSKTRPWRHLVSTEAVQAMGARVPYEGAVYLDITFVMIRPKSHYSSKGALRANAPRFPAKRPDRDKLERAIQDALTGIVYRDDCQVVDGPTRKVFGDRECAMIRVYFLD